MLAKQPPHAPVATPAVDSPGGNDSAAPLANLASLCADVLIVVTDKVTDIDLVSLFVARCRVPGKHVHDDELAVPVRRVLPRFRPAAGAGSGFARPAIELNGLISPNARMQARMLAVDPERIPELWRTVVETVRADGLALATNLQLDRHP